MLTSVHCRGENRTYQTPSLCIFFNVHPKVTVNFVTRLGTSFNSLSHYPQVKVDNKYSRLAIKTLKPWQFRVILVFQLLTLSKFSKLI